MIFNILNYDLYVWFNQNCDLTSIMIDLYSIITFIFYFSIVYNMICFLCLLIVN